MTISCQDVVVVAVGSISFTSTPSGAAIYIDNILQTGATTPSTISSIAVGSHSIKLTLSGYQDYTEPIIVVTSGGTTPVSATFAGSAYITSTPSVAEIFLAPSPGIPTDQLLTTPQTFTNMTAASSGATTLWNYKLTLSGYQDKVGNFLATAGTTTNVPLTFAASASFSSTPSGAMIFVDNVDTGLTTPNTVTGVIAGTRNYKLTKVGYANKTGTFLATDGTTTVVPLVTWTPASITATNMVITPSASPCIEGTCTIHVDVTWINNGETDGVFTPNITIDAVPMSPGPYPSQSLAAGTSTTKGFDIVNKVAGTYIICPSPNAPV